MNTITRGATIALYRQTGEWHKALFEFDKELGSSASWMRHGAPSSSAGQAQRRDMTASTDGVFDCLREMHCFSLFHSLWQRGDSTSDRLSRSYAETMLLTQWHHLGSPDFDSLLYEAVSSSPPSASLSIVDALSSRKKNHQVCGLFHDSYFVSISPIMSPTVFLLFSL